MMRLELERVRGKRINCEVDSLILTEGTLSYCVKGDEFNIDLDNIDSLIVTNSPNAAIAEVERLTNHTPETALRWIICLCEELEKRGIDYKNITIIDVAMAIEKQNRRKKGEGRMTLC